MSHNLILRNRAVSLRKKGFSIAEISDRLNISKGTSSLWLRDIVLTDKAFERLEKRRLLGKKRASEKLKMKIAHSQKEISDRVRDTLAYLDFHNRSMCRILCAVLYWGEGAKTGRRVGFINSDPQMVSTFLKLMRRAFPLNELKFRALVHIHEYHDEKAIKSFWSKLTGIPLSQFTKSYLKPHTKKVIRQGYLGCLRITYHNSRIVDELKMTYNILAKNLGA